MTRLETLLLIGGLLQLSILIASALVPRVLAWREALRTIDPLLRQLIWVHGAFIVLTIVGMATLSLTMAGSLADGSPLARGVCGFIGAFWLARLVVQFTVFDARPYLVRWPLRIGYHGLTVVFCYLAAVYGWAALA